MAQETVHWTRWLPIVLLALRNIVKPEIGSTPAELVYGTTLRLSGKIFNTTPSEAPLSELAQSLRNTMKSITTNSKQQPLKKVHFHTRSSARLLSRFRTRGCRPIATAPEVRGPRAGAKGRGLQGTISS